MKYVVSLFGLALLLSGCASVSLENLSAKYEAGKGTTKSYKMSPMQALQKAKLVLALNGIEIKRFERYLRNSSLSVGRVKKQKRSTAAGMYRGGEVSGTKEVTIRIPQYGREQEITGHTEEQRTLVVGVFVEEAAYGNAKVTIISGGKAALGESEFHDQMKEDLRDPG